MRFESFLGFVVGFAARPGNLGLFRVSRHLSVFCIALLFATSAWSAPMHAHCKVVPWTLTYTVDRLSSNMNIDGGVRIMPASPMPGPGEDTVTCKYELSDFSRVDLTLTFSGPKLLTSIPFSVGNNFYRTTSVNSTSTTILNAAFMSGVQTTLLFAEHNSDGFISGLGTDESPRLESTVETSLFFPSDFIDVQYHLRSDPGAQFTIAGASIVLTGKHYFRGVPAPATILLVAIGLVGMVLTNTLGRARSIVYRRTTRE